MGDSSREFHQKKEHFQMPSFCKEVYQGSLERKKLMQVGLSVASR